MTTRITQADHEAARRLLNARRIPSADGTRSGAEVLARIDNRRISSAESLRKFAAKYRRDQLLGDKLTTEEVNLMVKCQDIASSQRETVTLNKRDAEEHMLAPAWNGCLGMNRNREGTPMTHKRAPSPFEGMERFALRNSRSNGVAYDTKTDDDGVFLTVEAEPGFLTVEDSACSRGYAPTDATSAKYVGRTARRIEQHMLDAEVCRDAHRRSLEIARENGTLIRKRGRKHNKGGV